MSKSSNHCLGYKMQKTRFLFPFGLAQSPFSRVGCRAGPPPAVCLHSPAAQRCALVLHLASLLQIVSIPFGALEFASSSNSPGKHFLASENISLLGRGFQLRQRGIPPANRCSWRSPTNIQFFLAVNCNQTDNYVFVHVLDKSSFSHVRLTGVFSPLSSYIPF